MRGHANHVAAGGNGHHVGLSEVVEFQATAREAETLLEEIAARISVRVGLTSMARSDRLWSCRSIFQGIVDLEFAAELGCVLAVGPAGDTSDSHCRTYQANRQIYSVGDWRIVESHERWPSLASLMPFTVSEAEQVRKDMPLTQSVAQLFPGAPLKDVTAIFTIHHLTDFLPLIETAFALGLDCEDVTVIDKEYSYRDGERVDAHLRLVHGVRVYTYACLEEALSAHLARSERLGKRVVVMDDGGYVLPVVLTRLRAKSGCIAGVVEQTMSGIQKLAGHYLPMPLFSVAQSQVKATVESFGVADAAVRNALTLLPQEKFEGRRAMVIGYGRIGEEISNILRARRMQVAVYDEDIVRLVTAHERGYATDRDLGRLLSGWRPLVVFGCTGAGALTEEHFSLLEWDCYLISTTSRDREFALPALARLASCIERLGHVGTRYTLRSGAEVLVLAHGLPINFHHAQSLANRAIDLVLASVLVGGCVLASEEPGLVAGVDVEVTNKILRETRLLETYYDMWHHS
ncbi:MAG TPA: NAD(P)-dependent oxidoreductase [Solirubrobacteraceae bacterium]|jgi:S-adenosylhomocysteine hydrolase